MELGRSAWIRRERLERIATAERDRRAGRTALAIAALGEASEWPARAVLALALLPETEGGKARQVLEEGLDQWAQESGLAALDSDPVAAEGQSADAAFESLLGSGRDETTRSDAEPANEAFEAFQIELDRPIEPSELERAFAEAETQVDEMHDVNDVAAGVLFDSDFDALDVTAEDDLDPLEASARAVMAKGGPLPMDAASVPEAVGGRSPRTAARSDAGEAAGRSSRAVVVATLERWLQNLERSRPERMR